MNDDFGYDFNYLRRRLWGLVVLYGIFGAVTPVRALDFRDPTTPLNQAPRTESVVDLTLSAIADIGNKRFAIVNDERVYEGDSVGGAVIEKINIYTSILI